MPPTHFSTVRSFLLCLVAVCCSVLLVTAQGDTYTAQASVKTKGSVNTTAPLTVVINRYASEADRDALVGAVKKGGTAAAREWLTKRPDAGTLQLGGRTTPIKYAFGRPTGGGQLITIATAEPVVFLGAGVPGAKSAAGYELALVLLNVPASGAGHGELSPAAKVRVDAQGAIVTEDFAAENVVHLANVAKK